MVFEYEINPDDLRALARHLTQILNQTKQVRRFHRLVYPALVFGSFSGLAWLERAPGVFFVGLFAAVFVVVLGPDISETVHRRNN